jgi:V/A-type H+-transporting ATPase subunit A
MFDGLLRPLSGAGTWLTPARPARPDDPRPASPRHEAGPEDGRLWRFRPSVAAGDTVGPGQPLGAVDGAGAVPYLVLTPPGVAGVVEAIRPPGAYAGTATLATVAGSAVAMTQRWPVRRAKPHAGRLSAAAPLHTGQRVLDLLLPVTRGGTAAVPGGFGTGKTMLLQQIAKWCDADVIVYVGCGERGNELADVMAELAALEDPRTGGRLSQRTVVVANTSNMPMMAREASVYSAVTVAEHFRDMGNDAVVIADSTSRWAEALRELASRGGALPAEEGYPADLASALAAFYERAGRVTTLGGGQGSVTIIGAVSPAGGDLTEPVTTHTQRFVRCLWTLDRDLAYARHYPAVSWAASFSRDLGAVAGWHAGHGDPGWAERRATIASLLAEADRLAELAELVGAGALPARERVVLLAGRLLREGVLQQSALSSVDAASRAERGAALAGAALDVVDACQALAGRGVPAASIEEQDFSPLLRAREEAGAGDLAEIRARRDLIIGRLEALP